jgi:hypothetical protein
MAPFPAVVSVGPERLCKNGHAPTPCRRFAGGFLDAPEELQLNMV